jgi:hypothetical protein
MSDEPTVHIITFRKTGPWEAIGPDGVRLMKGKRNDVAAHAKALGAAKQAMGISSRVDEVDGMGRLIRAYPFYTDAPKLDFSDQLSDDEAEAEQEAAEAALAEAEGEAEEEERARESDDEAEVG